MWRSVGWKPSNGQEMQIEIYADAGRLKEGAESMGPVLPWP